VKSPEQSKEPWDYYIHKRTIPADQAFRPLDQGGCALAQG
jgi:branched-chain amino acid transport system substrate-binding protein